ncbi:hypothetical protein BKA57DRAFT_15010 [Linnemannia elongata]|nr:hypothetical protein BKA57DRAFT_15010 [Linnemannia elongata]
MCSHTPSVVLFCRLFLCCYHSLLLFKHSPFDGESRESCAPLTPTQPLHVPVNKKSKTEHRFQKKRAKGRVD